MNPWHHLFQHCQRYRTINQAYGITNNEEHHRWWRQMSTLTSILYSVSYSKLDFRQTVIVALAGWIRETRFARTIPPSSDAQLPSLSWPWKFDHQHLQCIANPLLKYKCAINTSHCTFPYSSRFLGINGTSGKTVYYSQWHQKRETLERRAFEDNTYINPSMIPQYQYGISGYKPEVYFPLQCRYVCIGWQAVISIIHILLALLRGCHWELAYPKSYR